MKKAMLVIAAVTLLASCASKTPAPFHPAPDPYVASRETDDGGFSRDYGFWMRSYSHTWADAHTHMPGGPDETRMQRFETLRNVMYEYNITNTAVYCSHEADLAHVAATDGRHIPVWMPRANDPDIEKLRTYKDKYDIRAVKIHNTWVIRAESEKQTWEFPRGSGKTVPVSIDFMVSPEWMAFFAACQELEIQVIWHATNRWGPSPYNFGGNNERYYKFLPYNNEYILGYIKHILTTYPRLKLMLAHSGFMGYRKLDGLFAEHPNLYIDTSAAFMLRNGDYLTDAERDRLRPFFIKWADRILFATDANAAADLADGMREEHHIRRHVNDFVKPHQNLIVALYLPQDALDKVTHGNFEKLFKAPRTDLWRF